MMYFNFFRFVSSKQTMFNPRSCLNQKKLRKKQCKTDVFVKWSRILLSEYTNTGFCARYSARTLPLSKQIGVFVTYPSTHTQNKEFLELLQQSKMHLGHPVKMHGCIPSNDK